MCALCTGSQVRNTETRDLACVVICSVRSCWVTVLILGRLEDWLNVEIELA